jgi:hypothetical protein
MKCHARYGDVEGHLTICMNCTKHELHCIIVRKVKISQVQAKGWIWQRRKDDKVSSLQILQ